MAGVCTLWKLANAAATDQGWFFLPESRGAVEGCIPYWHLLTGISLLYAHVSPFPWRGQVPSNVSVEFSLLIMTLFYFCKFCLVLFQVGCVIF